MLPSNDKYFDHQTWALVQSCQPIPRALMTAADYCVIPTTAMPNEKLLPVVVENRLTVFGRLRHLKVG